YAATLWEAHVRKSDQMGFCQDDLLNNFGWPSESLVQQWARIRDRLEPWRRFTGHTETTMLHIVSSLGLTGPLQDMIRRGTWNESYMNARDIRGRTALAFAARYGHTGIVRLLLDNGANVNATNVNQTALSYAAEYGHDAIVKLLLDKGADIDATEAFGWTALLHATDNGHEAAV